MRLKGVQTIRRRLADGSVLVHRYHRATRTVLPGEPGSAEFLAAYAAAQQPKRPAAGAEAAPTIGALVERFLGSPEFARGAEATRREYRRYLDDFRARHGAGPQSALEDKRIRKTLRAWRDQWADKPRAADYAWASIRRCLAWAYEAGEIGVNHALRGGRLYRGGERTERIWLDAHVEAFCAEASPELQWALGLALYTGQREADLLHLKWSQIGKPDELGRRWIRLRQRKTKRWVEIPVHRDLETLLAGISRRAVAVLTRPDGRPWPTEKGGLDHFRHEFRDAVEAAGLDDVPFEDGERGDLHFHDARGSAASALQAAGCDEGEICELIGLSRAALKFYLRRGDRRLALSGLLKLEAQS